MGGVRERQASPSRLLPSTWDNAWYRADTYHTRVEWIPGFKEQRTSTYRRVHTCAHTRTRTYTSIALGLGTAPALSDPLYLPGRGTDMQPCTRSAPGFPAGAGGRCSEL